MKKRITYIPEGATADISIDYLLGIIEDARTVTLNRVHGITIEELDWQYAEGWNSIGCLLSHIISTGHVFRIEFIEGRELTAAEETIYMPGLTMGKYIPELLIGEPLSYYLPKLAEARELLEASIKRLSKVDFFEKRAGYNQETGCNLAWILYHLAEDEVHHRGQISILRKLYKAQVERS